MKKLFIAVAATLTFYGCGSGSYDAPGVEIIEAYKPQTDIGYRFLRENSQTEKVQANRSYAFEITNFDKDNPLCWKDLVGLAEKVAEPLHNEGMTMVYFFAPSDSLMLFNDEGWNISWDESQDSLWIGNYNRYGWNGNTQLVKNWK